MNSRLNRLLLAAALGLSLAGGLFAADKATKAPEPKKESRIEVVFKNPDEFTDVKDSSMQTDSGRDYVLSTIKEFIEERADKLLAQGLKLRIEFTDIDLAGEYEPWRRPPLNDVRFLKDTYPPRMNFSYTITDASGAVVKQGTERLFDMAFMTRIPIDRNDMFRYEKDLLGDWMRDALPPGEKKR